MTAAVTFATFAVTLDGRPALPHVRAAVVDGRVLLPVRTLGEALDADVSYDAASHRIVVQRGARVATLPARGAVRIVRGRSYAPLRAIANAFGIGVAYDGTARTIALQDRPRATGGAATSGAGMNPGGVPLPVRPAVGSVAPLLTPAPGSAIHAAYPSISARFPGTAAIDPGSLRVTVDGRDVSRDAAVVGDEVLYTPRTALSAGTHDVAVDARAVDGAPLHSAWSFQDSFAFAPSVAPTPFPITAIYLDRWVSPGTNAFDVIVQGSPGLTGFVGVDGLGGIFPLTVLSANAYVAHVFVPPGIYQPYARVAARITLPNGTPETIVLPQTVSLYTPRRAAAPPPAAVAPTPTPVPHVRVIPTMPRSANVPTPYPTPSPAPSAAAPAAAAHTAGPFAPRTSPPSLVPTHTTAPTLAPQRTTTVRTPPPHTAAPIPRPTPMRTPRHYPRSRTTAGPSSSVPS